MAQFSEVVRNFIEPTTAKVVGFVGQGLWLAGENLFTFHVGGLSKRDAKNILADFIIIRASSPYNMILGRSWI